MATMDIKIEEFNREKFDIAMQAALDTDFMRQLEDQVLAIAKRNKALNDWVVSSLAGIGVNTDHTNKKAVKYLKKNVSIEQHPMDRYILRHKGEIVSEFTLTSNVPSACV